MPKIQITAKGIRSALKKYAPYQSIAEYIWNGFDAKASVIKLDFLADAIGNLESITVTDNGYGIPHDKLQEKFEPLFESKKAFENKLKKNQSVLHGKNGIGRLTFFTFARNAVWKTVYQENEKDWTYDIYANADNINFYTGVNAVPRQTESSMGTSVTFTGIHALTASHLEEKFQDFLLKEFSWFLALNAGRDFNIILNGKKLDYALLIADQEKTEFIHEKTKTAFNVTYIRWEEKMNTEASRYYYLNAQHAEQWKEPTAIKNKGEQFYHSVFIQSPYFDSFSFQKIPAENQPPLLAGTRSDPQFKFLRKNLANFLRIKRRPFLKSLAENLLLEYKQKNILPLLESAQQDQLSVIIKTLYEMQPRFFSSLNTEQKKMLTGLLAITLSSSAKRQLPELISDIVELSTEEQAELKRLLMDEFSL